MIPRSVLCIFVFLAPAFAQQSPSISIRQTDFRNFSYPFNPAWGSSVPEGWDWMPTPRESAQLRNGRLDFPRGRYMVVGDVTYGDLDGDGGEEAAVITTYGTGGTAQWEYLYVYKRAGRGVELMGLLQTGSRGSGGLLNILIEDGRLILDFADPDRRSGDCCSLGLIRVTHRFETPTRKFVESSRQRNAIRPWEYTPGAAVSLDAKHAASIRSDREVWIQDTGNPEAHKLFECPGQCRNPRFSPDAQSVFVVVDMSRTAGGLWKINMQTGAAAEFIPNVAIFRVIQSGPYPGFIIADQPTLTEPDGTPFDYPFYVFFIFRPNGSRVGRIGEVVDDPDKLLIQYSQ